MIRVEQDYEKSTTQLNSTDPVTQLNSVQPISAKQVRRVFVYDVTYTKFVTVVHADWLYAVQLGNWVS